MVEPAGQDRVSVDPLETSLFDVLESDPDGIVILSADGKVLFVNRTAESMLGQVATDLVGSTLEIDINAADDDGVAEVRIRQVNWRGTPASVIHLHQVTSNAGDEVDAHRATHDAVTGLPNVYLFNDRVTQVLARAERGEPGVLLFYCGLRDPGRLEWPGAEPIADVVLQEVAHSLTRVVRQSDTIAYLGNGEFAVLCDQPDERRSLQVEARIRGAFSHALASAGVHGTMTIRIGSVSATDSLVDASMLLEWARKGAELNAPVISQPRG
jgi:diguanylate cyclase (GGDEF)-like protein